MKGLAIIRWLACLVAVIAVVVLVTGGKPPKPHTAPSTAARAVKLALGVQVLILFAVRQRRRMGRSEQQAADLDGQAGPPLAVGRRRARCLPAALDTGGRRRSDDRASEARHGGGLPGQAWSSSSLLATSSFLVMELYATFADQRRRPVRFEQMRAWIDSHRDQAIIVGSLVVGFWLVADSIYLIVA